MSMKAHIEDMEHGEYGCTALAANVLVVVVRRVDGWAAYVVAVPGEDHSQEVHLWRERGIKLKEGVARAVLSEYFFPPVNPGELPYAR